MNDDLYGKSDRELRAAWQDIRNLPGVQEQKVLYEMQAAMCDGGIDADEFPNGTGRFGLVASNPVPCMTIFGSIAYLGRLRAADGAKVQYERTGSTPSAVTPMPVDMYRITHPNGTNLGIIYVSPYQKRISAKAPAGFMLAKHSFAKVTPPVSNRGIGYAIGKTVGRLFSSTQQSRDLPSAKNAPPVVFPLAVEVPRTGEKSIANLGDAIQYANAAMDRKLAVLKDGNSTVVQRLRKLQELYEEDLITDEEYADQKGRILGEI